MWSCWFFYCLFQEMCFFCFFALPSAVLSPKFSFLAILWLQNSFVFFCSTTICQHYAFMLHFHSHKKNNKFSSSLRDLLALNLLKNVLLFTWLWDVLFYTIILEEKLQFRRLCKQKEKWRNDWQSWMFSLMMNEELPTEDKHQFAKLSNLPYWFQQRVQERVPASISRWGSLPFGQHRHKEPPVYALSSVHKKTVLF